MKSGTDEKSDSGAQGRLLQEEGRGVFSEWGEPGTAGGQREGTGCLRADEESLPRVEKFPKTNSTLCTLAEGPWWQRIFLSSVLVTFNHSDTIRGI